MSLWTLIITLVIVGVVLGLINKYINMEADIKKLLNVAVIVVMVFWVLGSMGLLDDIQSVRVGR